MEAQPQSLRGPLGRLNLGAPGAGSHSGPAVGLHSCGTIFFFNCFVFFDLHFCFFEQLS